MMKILPVLDLLDGIVVRGVAGKRNAYRRVESQLVDNADPLLVAEAFRDHFGFVEIYLADLDAILHDRPNLPIYEALANHGFSLIVDAGLRETDRAGELFAHGVSAVIAGLETIPSPELTSERLAAGLAGLLTGPERLAEMGAAAHGLAQSGAAARIAEQAISLAEAR